MDEESKHQHEQTFDRVISSARRENNLIRDQNRKQPITPGLYKTGSNYTYLIASWDELLAANVVSKDGHSFIGGGLQPTYKAIDMLAGDLVLPEGITELEDCAYCTCDRLTGIILPQSLTSIGKFAFAYCDGLTEVVIPDSVTSIGESAFEECVHIKNVTIGPNVTFFGEFAFANCDEITKVTIREGATLIGPWMFFKCEKLAEINMPSSVTTIREGAFGGCQQLKSINVPANTTSISPRAFVACEGLEAIAVNADNLVYYSWGNCLIEAENKTLVLGCANSVIPDDGRVTKIGNHAFCTTSKLTNITLPNVITSIGEGAFSRNRLVHIDIPSSVESVGAYAFSGCPNLETVVFQKNSKITEIGEAAFNDCPSLASVDVLGSAATIERTSFGGCESC